LVPLPERNYFMREFLGGEGEEHIEGVGRR
jgi:hypothetical protein